MKAETIDAAINELVAEISERQEAIKLLRRVGGYDVGPANHGGDVAPLRHKRGPKGRARHSVRAAEKVVAPVGAQKTALLNSPAPLAGGKPDTVVGAIKLLLRDETEPFTADLLRENLREDADYKKLLETEAGGRALSNALYQWTAVGRLKKEGDNYTVTAAGREWFSK